MGDNFDGHVLEHLREIEEAAEEVLSEKQAKSLQRCPAAEDFYGTGFEIWAGFGSVGITEK